MSLRANAPPAPSVAALSLSSVAILFGGAPAPAPAAVGPDAVRAALLARPEILAEAAQALQARQESSDRVDSVALVEANRDALFGADGPAFGNPTGSKVVVEFFDYQCGFCRNAQPELLKAVEADRELKVIVRDFPILGEGSVVAAKAAIAAGVQDPYRPLHHALVKQPPPLDDGKVLEAARVAGADLERLRADMESEAVEAAVRDGQELARKLGINGTPSFAALGSGILKGFGNAARFTEFMGRADRP